jgi:chromosome segregation ATPase
VAGLREQLRLAATQHMVSVTQRQELEQQLREMEAQLLGAQAEVTALQGRASSAEAAQQSSSVALKAKEQELSRYVPLTRGLAEACGGRGVDSWHRVCATMSMVTCWSQQKSTPHPLLPSLHPQVK